ncbi:hypothetical protein TWF788_008160 [Orbilia oligospora]|uniref:Rhodopsin domain-containing protein n=1 Tax=Orbilia oligospora TaxID=2813651 RepID=A0A7C8Q2L3_ORBOL|nr:hypothetical protein TWF788_008160 [Orbilia oligospora]
MASPRSWIALEIVGNIFVWIFTALRCYTRIKILRIFNSEDALVLLSSLLSTSRSAVFIAAIVNYGVGLGMPSETDTIHNQQKYYYIQQMLFIPGTGVIKISFALTLLKIVQDRIEIFALYFIVFAATAITLIPFFWFLLACQPISLNWALGSESCYVNERTSIFNGHGAITAFLDLVLGIVIPAIVLHRLKVRLRVKVIAGAMLSVASLACIATIIRIVYTTRMVFNNYDSVATCYLWGGIELSTTIVCVCATTLKPLLVKVSFLNLTSYNEDRSRYEMSRQVRDSTIRGNSHFCRKGSVNIVNEEVPRQLQYRIQRVVSLDIRHETIE